jgi:hypothetical protein
MLLLHLSLMFLTTVGAMSTEPHNDQLATPPIAVPDHQFVLIAGVMSAVRPPGPVFFATDAESSHSVFSGAQSICVVFSDARHSALLTRSLLIRAGVEQNPGPDTRSTAKQTHLDSQGNIMEREGAPGSSGSQSAPQNQNPTLFDILSELRAFRQEARDDVKSVRADVDQQGADLRKVEDKQTDLEQENASLKDKISQLEDFNRRNNIIVGGIPEGNGRETWEDVEEKVRQSIIADLGMAAQAVDKLAIDRASRLGKRRQGGSRPVKVAFANLKDKDSVLRRAREVKPETPYFREDFSIATLDARTQLKPGLLAARDKHLQAYLSHDKLVVQQGERKNVYKYNQDCKQVKPIVRSFDDGIVWPNADENDR